MEQQPGGPDMLPAAELCRSLAVCTDPVCGCGQALFHDSSHRSLLRVRQLQDNLFE